MSITFTYPENGIYWNDKKIVPYPVPFILHGNGELETHGWILYRVTPIECTISGSIERMEIFFDDVLIAIVTAPPWEYEWPVLMTSFSHFNEKIIVYGTHPGDWSSDEITVWRLFI